MDKKTSFQYKVFTIMLIVIILVGFTGFYAYQQFSQIISKISAEAKADMRLVTAKSLMNDIFEAENSVKSFSLTKDTTYLDRFYIAAEKSDSKLESLKEFKPKNKEIHIDIDSLNTLIIKKFNILNDLLLVQDKYRVEEALNKVVIKIEKNIVENNKVDSVIEPDREEKRSLLNWLFNKNKKSKRKEDSSVVINKTAQEIKKQVQVIKKEEENIEQALKKKELELLMADKKVTLKIKRLLDELEKNELIAIEKQAMKAELAMAKTNKQIAIFCTVAALLLFLVIYIIINYVRNNARYRKALKQAKAKAEDLALTKERFLANMSHEIRTPMNAIAGFTEQISKGPLNHDQREQLNMVTKSVEHLLYLINDVLDFTKLQAGKLKLESIDFKPEEVVNDVITFIQPLAKEKSITINAIINTDKDTVLRGDPYRLRQILLNLISNSVKFTDKGNINVRLSTLLKNNDNVRMRLEVLDTGIGMTEIQMDKIFNEFEQADASTSRNYGGTGLGLSIVNMLVNLQDGKIDLKSKPSEGTSVIVEIPYLIGDLNEVKILDDDNTLQDITIPKGLKILIVDDEDYNRKLLTTILKKHNVSYTEAKNGLEAIAEVKSNDYDLILMDARMPELDGLSATKEIRNLSNDKKNVPIIALTAAVSQADRETYSDIGMNGFLAKPFKENELLSIINNVIGINQDSITIQANENSNDKLLDFSDLKKLSGDDVDFYNDMLETFIETTSSGIKDMKVAIEENDWDMLAECAHKISSPCKHLGANQLYSILKEIEESSRNKDNLDDNGNKLDLVKDQFKKIKKLVEQELRN